MLLKVTSMLLNVTHAHCVIVCVDGKSLYSVIIKFAGCVCVLILTCAIVSSSRLLTVRNRGYGPSLFTASAWDLLELVEDCSRAF